MEKIEGDLIDCFNKHYLLKDNFIPLGFNRERSTVEVAIPDPSNKDLLSRIEQDLQYVLSDLSYNTLKIILSISFRYFHTRNERVTYLS